MKLYYTPGACSLSPHIVLIESGLPYELVKVDLATKKTESGSDYFKVNAKGAVPALELDSGEVLTEGAVIIQYLADKVPEKALLPQVPSLKRYRVMEWLNFIATDFQKSFTSVFNPAYAGSKDAAVKTLKRHYAYINEQLKSKTWLLDSFTIADAYLFTIAGWAQWAGLSLDAWPELAAYMKRVGERESVKRAMKEEGLA